MGPRNILHDLSTVAQVSWVGSVLYADPAEPITTAGEELDDLLWTDQIDHDLAEV